MRHLPSLAVFWLVFGIVACVSPTKRKSMRNGLDSLNAVNRADGHFIPADVEPYVNFFDRHGTANDRMLANYLMGRAYHDGGDAPMALQFYQKAVSCADTMSSDCDYLQLSRVYGQMAGVYYMQGLPMLQIPADIKASKYSQLADDTLSAIIFFEQLSSAYESMNRPDSALFVIDSVDTWYLAHGEYQSSAVSRGLAVSFLLERGDLEKAQRYIGDYEKYSGYFDSNGNIESGREIFYELKGKMCCKNGEYDSAEYWFRKELVDGKDFNNQNAAARGLAVLYDAISKPDSAAKYALYATQMTDSFYSQKSTKIIANLASVYDYSHIQQVAKIESDKKRLFQRYLLVSVLCLFTVVVGVIWLMYLKNCISRKLREATDEIVELRVDRDALKENLSENSQVISDYDKRIRQLEKRLGRYGKIVYFNKNKAEVDLQSSYSYIYLKSMLKHGMSISPQRWERITKLIEEYFPGFFDFLALHFERDTVKFRICVLLRLHFINKEVAALMDYTPAYISMLSSQILQELFGKMGGSKDLAKKLSEIT